MINGYVVYTLNHTTFRYITIFLKYTFPVVFFICITEWFKIFLLHFQQACFSQRLVRLFIFMAGFCPLNYCLTVGNKLN